MENKYKNCFAYQGESKECKILTEKLCETKGRCPFYKTNLQFTSSRAIAKLRNKNAPQATANSLESKQNNNIDSITLSITNVKEG